MKAKILSPSVSALSSCYVAMAPRLIENIAFSVDAVMGLPESILK